MLKKLISRFGFRYRPDGYAQLPQLTKYMLNKFVMEFVTKQNIALKYGIFGNAQKSSILSSPARKPFIISVSANGFVKVLKEFSNKITKGEMVDCFEEIEEHLMLFFFWFARHGRALTGESPEHAQIVGSV